MQSSILIQLVFRIRGKYLVTVPFNLPGFILTRLFQAQNEMVISAQAVADQAACPTCQVFSERVHSYYTRSPKALPFTTKAVQLVLRVRRFRCLNPACAKQTFVEKKDCPKS